MLENWIIRLKKVDLFQLSKWKYIRKIRFKRYATIKLKGEKVTIKLDNPEIEHYFVDEFKSDIKSFSEFILQNLKQHKNKKEFNVIHLDPKKNSYKLKFDELDDVSEDDNPFKDINDVATYARKLRDKSWR